MHTTPTHRDRLAPAGANLVAIIGRSTMPNGVRVRYTETGVVSTIHRSHLDPLAPPPDPKPFYVLTRKYRANGDCEKRTHTFATRNQQVAFIRRTTRAVTAHN